MKLPCKVIEDMLPMYHDCICSDETATLIEEHLKDCPKCAQVLNALHNHIDIPETPVDDLKPLARIQKKWINCKRSYIRRGICITLAALLLIGAALSSIWYFSYAKYYFRMADNMERTPAENAFTSSDYTTVRDGYRFEVWMPILFSNSGFARVMDENGLVMFVYPEAGGAYSFWLHLTDEENASWSVHLKSDMTPDFEGHPFPVRSETEKAHITQLLIQQQEDVAAMLDAVANQWGIELLEYAP